MKSKIFTIPNLITILRILLIPVFAVAMFFNMIWGFAFFLICASTDLVDGFVARRFNMVSDIGKFLDPVADKLMHITVMICMSVIYASGIPPYFILAAIITAKELFMLIFGMLLIRRKVVVPANWYGKAASFLLSIGILLLFFGKLNGVGRAFYISGFAVSAVGVAVALVALSVYIVKIARQLNYKMPEGKDKIEIDTMGRDKPGKAQK